MLRQRTNYIVLNLIVNKECFCLQNEQAQHPLCSWILSLFLFLQLGTI